MTKRILAIVMALVLSLSVLSFEAFASFDKGPSIDYSGTTVTVNVGSRSGATSYSVALLRNGSSYQTRSNLAANATATFAGVATGSSYSARVTAYDANGVLDTATTGTITVPLSGSTTTGTITVNGNTVSWTAVKDVTVERYDVDYTVRLSNNTTESRSKNAGTATSTTLDVSSGETLLSVTVYYTVTGKPRQTYGTVNVTGSSTTTPSTGNVAVVGTTLRWTPVANAIEYYIVGVNAYGATIINTATYNAYFDFSGYASLNNYITFTVTAAVRGVNGKQSVGTATYNPYSTGTGTGTGYATGIYVTLTGYGTATVTWYDYTGGQYLVVVNGVSQVVTGNTANIAFTYGVATTVYVYHYNASSANGVGQLVGTANISATGTVTGGTGSAGSYYGNNGNTVNGNNCTLSVGSTSTVVSWNASYYGYSTQYTVVYTVENENPRVAYTYNNSYTIPVGSSKSFTVNIVLGNSIIGSATYTAPASSNPTTSKVTGLTLTLKNSSTTTVSWEAISGATTYEIDYTRAGYSTAETQYTSKTSYDIPFGKNVGFVVNVYAIVNGRFQTVGTATHKAGDDYPSSSSSGNNNSSADNTPAFVTNLKGVATDKQVSLSWDAAKGNPGYDIYWKRESANEWKKAASNYSKRAVNIKGLINGTSYQFKVVANGRDSGILTITPQASGSTTRTAADPDGGASRVPVITSATGGSGTISVEWSGVTGGNLYKVYLSTDGRSYTRYAQVTGTSATINNLDAGKYWVRIKASTNNGSTWTELKDCKEATVTVK